MFEDLQELVRLSETISQSQDASIKQSLAELAKSKASRLIASWPDLINNPEFKANSQSLSWLFDELLAAAPASSPISDEISEQEPPTQEQIQKAESLIRQARLAKSRGQKQEATKLLEQASMAAPNSVPVLEAVADDLVERMQPKKAMEFYKRALEIEPKNIPIERKYAECTLRLASSSDPFMLLSRESDFATLANAKSAFWLSLFFPGVGQLVLGEKAKGIGMLLGWIIGWGLALAIPGGVSGVAAMFGVYAQGVKPPLNGFGVFCLLMAVFCHLWAIVDAASKAKTAEKRQVLRPTPPVDKPFEL